MKLRQERVVKGFCLLCLILVFVSGQAQITQAQNEEEGSLSSPSKTTPGEEASSQEKEKAQGKTYQATLKPSQSFQVSLELEAYNGPLWLESIAEDSQLVEEGEPIFNLDAPDFRIQDDELAFQIEKLDREIENAEQGHELFLQQGQLQWQRAELNFERAVAEYEYFEAQGKADTIERHEINLESLRNSIADQKDELAQLEELYETNDLAKESQEIVLERARRRLRQSERTLALEEREFQYALEQELPRKAKELRQSIEEAEFALEKLEIERRKNKESYAINLRDYEHTLEKVEVRREKLDEDAFRLELLAPFTGIFVLSKELAQSQKELMREKKKVYAGQVFGYFIDPEAPLMLELNVPFEELSLFTDDPSEIKVVYQPLGLEVQARLNTVGRVAQEGKVRITIELESEDLIPGLEVEIKPASSQDSN